MNFNSLTLRAGDSVAEVNLVGAALTNLRLGERVLIPKVNPRTRTYFGSLLAPWPNRIKAAAYSFDGQAYVLEAGDGIGNALHGLVFQQQGQILAQSESAVKIGIAVPVTSGYPFQISIEVSYHLMEDQFSVEIEAKNQGKNTAPIGLGHHPYFTVDADTKVEIRAVTAYVHDNFKIPSKQIESAQLELGEGRAVNVMELDLDTQFSGLQHPAATLSYAPESFDLWVSGGDYLMVYTPKDFPWESGTGPAIAIEPQTCGVDAFNSQQGLTQLASGEALKLAWGIKRVR